MDTAKAIELRNRCDPHTAESNCQPLFRTRGPKQRPPCWTIEDDMAMLDTAFRGFTCGPIYIIRDIESNIDDVFDGAHRCEAIFKFINGKYPITKGKKDEITWKTSPIKDHVGKYFHEIPKALQQQLKDYKFNINIIDAETANDPAALGILWKRLSKAGARLNNFEEKSQTHSLFHRTVLDVAMKNWFESPLFTGKVSKRGDLELMLNTLLALSETEELPKSYNSMQDLVKIWETNVLGETVEEIDRNTQAKRDIFLERLTVLRNILKELQDKNVFHNDKGELIVDKRKDLILLMILGRLGYWFRKVSAFKAVSTEKCEFIKKILQMNPNDLCKSLGVTSRNATFQKKFMAHIDSQFKSEKSERRFYTIEEKKRKLLDQNNICPACSTTIFEHQRYEGDHIVEFSRGGKTTYENLQILHKECHEKKNMNTEQ